MSVDHRDVLLWPQKDNLNKEDYLYGSHTLLDNSNGDITCKTELHTGCWAGSTPVKDSSPSSTEPTSMLSEKSSSRGTVETKNSENTCFSTDTVDTEHPISEGSLPPSPSSHFPAETSGLVSCSVQISPTGIIAKSEPDVSKSSSTMVSSTSVHQGAYSEQFPNAFADQSSEYKPTSAANDRPLFYSSHSNYYSSPRHNRIGFLNKERPLYHMRLPFGYDMAPDRYYSDTRKFPDQPSSDSPSLPSKPPPCPPEAYCQTTPPKFSSFYQSSRPVNPYFWRVNSRQSTLIASPHDSLEVRKRFVIQQMHQNVQTNWRLSGTVGRQLHHHLQNRLQQTHYSYSDPCSLFNCPPAEFTESLERVSVYSTGGGRFPHCGYASGVNSFASDHFVSPYPWLVDNQRCFTQSKEFRPTLASPKKRTTSTRNYKRKRAQSSNGNNAALTKSSAEVYDSLALSRLLSINVAQCVSRPELENPIDIYPPEPAMIKKKLPCHEVPPNLETTPRTGIRPHRTRKYASLPFILRSPGVVDSRDLLSYLNNDQKTNLDSNKNLLSNALAAAVSRLGESRLLTAPPSPPTICLSVPDPLNLFTKRKEESVSISDIVLLPPKRRRISGSVVSEMQSNQESDDLNSHRFFNSRNSCSEKRLTMDMIRSNVTSVLVCQQCKMHILFSSGLVTDSVSPSEETFCSELCMQRYKSAPKLRRPSLTALPSTYADSSIAPVPVLLRTTSSKLCKTTLKTSPSKCRRSQLELSLRTSIQRWKGSRWTIFSSSKSPVPSRLDIVRAAAIPNSAFELLSTTPLPKCVLCKCGSGETDESVVGRYLNYTWDKWVHVNCILWCYGVYETVGGCFMNVAKALEQAEHQLCEHCSLSGAGVPCFAGDCTYHYHVYCAYKSGCYFYEDKSMFCPKHKDQAPSSGRLTSFDVKRRVYLDRDEYTLVADVIGTQCLTTSGNRLCLRIGTLVLDSLGQLLPEHLESGRFHNISCIYPVGFSTTRIYWSYRRPGQRCHYVCIITDSSQISQIGNDPEFLGDLPSAHPSPIFSVIVKEPGLPDACFKAGDCNILWQHILRLIRDSRQQASPNALRLLPEMLQGESLFGLNEPHIIRAIESLPGVEHLTGYVFKFGKMQLISRMPVMINPTGCARSEPKRRNYVRSCDREQEPGQERVLHQNYPTASQPHLGFLRPLNQIPHYCSSSASLSISSPSGPAIAPAGKQSPSTQYRALQNEWRNNVLLARSKIQGLGLFASRDIEKNEFIIEYLGQLIRNEVSNRRERLYESQNRGIYMFRADDNWIVDATMYGGLARYINHSCEPNCIAEVILYENQKRIIIIANRLIKKGEELTYDYKLDVETDKGSRIPCLCGSQFCRKWMN